MAGPSDDVLAYFGASPARLATLETLCEGSMDRAALQAAVDTSRITLWRLLNDLEDRGWVRETQAGVEATAAGRLVVERIGALPEALAAIERLDDLLDWLPLAEMKFPIERLAEAEIVRPTASDPQGPMRLAARQVDAASTLRILTHGFSPQVIERMHERGLTGEQTGQIVTSTGVLDTFIAEDTLRQQLHDLIDGGHLTYYHYEGAVPHILAILDGERVGIGVDDDEGHPLAALDVEDDVVVGWAERTFERYRANARPLDPSCFIG